MGLKNLLGGNRCKECKINRNHRYCLYIGKNICWSCCNKIRAEKKCPPTCRYAFKKEENGAIRTSFDSETEYWDALEKYAEYWLTKPQAGLNGKIPRLLWSEDKKAVLDFLESLPPTSYTYAIKKALGLKADKPEKNSPEQTAKQFMAALQSFDYSAAFVLYRSSLEKSEEEVFSRRLANISLLRKIESTQLISSASNREKDTFLIFYEINNRYNLTLRIKRDKDSFIVDDFFLGEPQQANTEGMFIKELASYLAERNLTEAEKILKALEKVFVNSADIFYYKGIYLMFLEKPKEALAAFLTSVEIDPSFGEAWYNIGFLHHKHYSKEQAKLFYQKALAVTPNEAKIFNNLGILCEEENAIDEAIGYYKKCLELEPSFTLAQKNLERLQE